MNEWNLKLVTQPSFTFDEVKIHHDGRPFLERVLFKPKTGDDRIFSGYVAGRMTIDPFVVEGPLRPGMDIPGEIDFGDVIVTRLICVEKLSDNTYKCVADLVRQK